MVAVSRRVFVVGASLGLAAMFVVAALGQPTPSQALPSYAAATGQPCSSCHVNPSGGGPLTGIGQAFAAIPTHSSDPAGAFAQLSGQPAPAPSGPAPSGGKGGPPAAPATGPAPAPPTEGAPEGAAPAADMAAVEDLINSKLNNLDRSLKLWDIQPGLGTIMIEYGTRFNNVWFAAQAGNWDMVRYQVLEMTEIQEVGETTRPARAPALMAFEHTYLDPLTDAAEAKSLSSFTAAYDRAITGCNSCHASSTSTDFPGGYRFVKIQRPTAPTLSNVDWKGQ